MESNEPIDTEQAEQIIDAADSEFDLQALADTGDFNLVRLQSLLKQSIEGFKNGKTNLEMYISMLIEWTKMFKHMGKGISVAFKGKHNNQISASHRSLLQFKCTCTFYNIVFILQILLPRQTIWSTIGIMRWKWVLPQQDLIRSPTSKILLRQSLSITYKYLTQMTTRKS